MAVHDVVTLLDRCVNSVRDQTHDALQIVLVDDGSTDGSGALADEHARRDPRITVVHQPNAGLSAARNSGLRIAAGSHVMFVDGDDWVHPDLVATLLGLVAGHAQDIAVSSFQRTSGTLSTVDPAHAPVHRFDREQALAEWAGARHTVLTIACGKLIPRHLLEGIDFPEGRLHEDEFTTHRVLSRATRVHLTEAQLYYYWQRPDSIMGSGFTVPRGVDAVDAAREQVGFLEREGMPDIAAVVRGQLARRLVRLLGALDPVTDHDLRTSTLIELRQVARAMSRERQPVSLRMFTWGYATFPRAARTVHSAYGRVVRTTA